MPKQVLYISYDGLTDPLGQSQVLPYLQGLSELGYHFTILSFEKKDRFAKDRAIIENIIHGKNIEWCPLFFTSKPPILSKVYDRYRMFLKARSLHRTKKFELIHCRSYIAAETGLRLKKKYGTKLVFDMRGFWADEKVDNGQWNMNSILYRSIYSHYKKKEREFLLYSDAIISLTFAAKEYLVNQNAYKNLSITVIPCCADLNHFNYAKVDKEEADKLKASLHIPKDAKVITYLGSIGGWYMTREMFQFFKMVIDRFPDFIFLLLTKDNKEKVETEAMSFGIPKKSILVTYSDRKMLPLYLSFTYCSLFFIRNTFSKIASSPTKHGELMGMGIPVICNDIGDTGWIINETKTGFIVPSFDEQSLTDSVTSIEILQDIKREYIRTCAFQYFDLSAGIEKYAEVYGNLLSPTCLNQDAQ